MSKSNYVSKKKLLGKNNSLAKITKLKYFEYVLCYTYKFDLNS